MLRILEEYDLECIFGWRNDLNVRSAMFSQHKISWEEHLTWFQRMKSDESKKWFLYLDDNDKPTGVVYFQNIDFLQSTAFWGFYSAIGARPGTGIRMSIDGLNKAFNEFGFERVNAEVLVKNVISMDFHKKVGFIADSDLSEQRLDFIRLRMLASEWPQHRNDLLLRIARFD